MSREIPEFSPQDFFCSGALFREHKIEGLAQLHQLAINGRLRIDQNCINCKRLSIFHNSGGEALKVAFGQLPSSGAYTFEFTCQRCSIGKLFFAVFLRAIHSKGSTHLPTRFMEGRLFCFGQYPSFSDIAAIDFQKYSSVLSPSQKRELQNAVRLSSFGYNVGAFVYLRRIFEGLVESHFDASHLEESKETFLKKPMDQKIDELSSSLPSFLSENRKVYNILSEGLHRLTEERCAQNFPILFKSIVMIVEEDLEKESRQRRQKELAAELSRLQEKRSLD